MLRGTYKRGARITCFAPRSDDLPANELSDYLFEQLLQGQHFVASPTASRTLKRLKEHLPKDQWQKLQQALQENLPQPRAAWTLAQDAVDGYLRSLSTKKGSSEQLVGESSKFMNQRRRTEPLGNRNNKAYR